MNFNYRYNLEEKPPPLELFLYSLQWLTITLPGILIIGKVVGTLHFSQPADQVLYLQKICFVTGLSLFFQILAGHRLPLVTGPAAVLLIGIIASQGFSLSSIYTAILLNGLLLVFLSLSGLFDTIQKLFTTKVVAVVLLLIAFTLTPTILRLITGPEDFNPPFLRLLFAFIFIPTMFISENLLSRIWKSTLVVWAMIAGTLLYFILFNAASDAGRLVTLTWLSSPFHNLTTEFTFDWGVIISFLFCFMALSINDLGSIQSLKGVIDLPDINKRTRKGITWTGLSNILSGFLGVIGSVNYSISPGIILSTRCASRYTLLPTAGILLALSCSPLAIAFMASIPQVVIGCVLFYILSNQVAAGLTVAIMEKQDFVFRDGLGLGIPVLIGTVISFLPTDILAGFPAFLRPIAGNGFVVGVVASLLVEHVIFRMNVRGKD